MWRLRPLLLLLCLLGAEIEAQGGPQFQRAVQNVAFVEEGSRGLNTASSIDTGDQGISRLKDLVEQYGAQVGSITLDSPIDEQYELVVLIRPTRSLSARQAAYLWNFLQRGGHLLLALDPYGHNGVRGERAIYSGISQLLYADYGISVVDDFLIEPWFSVESLSDPITSWSEAKAEEHIFQPITEPILTYDLPIRYWGGRSVFVDGLTAISDTNALLYTETPYGETERVNIRDAEEDQLVFNIGDDHQGRLLLGAIAENASTGSRVALIGDSEIFQNIFGQTQMSNNESVPRYPGNTIFTQRLVAWLMGLPEEEWLELPDSFTWLALDGELEDWPVDIPSISAPALDVALSGYDIEQVRALHNDQFLYLAVETASDIPEHAQFTVAVETNDVPLTIIFENGQGWIATGDEFKLIEDAGYAISTHAEIRLPLRITGDNPRIAQICVGDASLSHVDCLDEQVESTVVNTIDPVPLRFDPGPSAFLNGISNMRSGPGENDPILVQLPGRTLLSVVGRNEAGDWLYLRNGRYEGWVAAFLVTMNTDVSNLPVIPDSANN